MHFFERIFVCDCIKNKKSFCSSHVLIPHCRVLFFACSVKNVHNHWLFTNQNLFSVRILNGGIIFFKENALYEINSECRFSNSSSTKYNKPYILRHIPHSCFLLGFV